MPGYAAQPMEFDDLALSTLRTQVPGVLDEGMDAQRMLILRIAPRQERYVAISIYFAALIFCDYC
jgi:hypothetical protein